MAKDESLFKNGLDFARQSSNLLCMISEHLNREALEMALEDRLELARRLVESVVSPAPLAEAVNEGIQRIEAIAEGQVAGLTEEQFRAALE